MNTPDHPNRRLRTGRWLRAAACLLFALLSGCQTTTRHEAYEISAFTGDERSKFFSAELARVAPELNRASHFVEYSAFSCDPRSQRILRSKAWAAKLVEEVEHRSEAKRIPYVSIQSRPTGKKDEMEISVATGYGRWLPVAHDDAQSGGAVIGASAGAVVAGQQQGEVFSGTAYQFTPLSEKPYRSKVIMLH